MDENEGINFANYIYILYWNFILYPIKVDDNSIMRRWHSIIMLPHLSYFIMWYNSLKCNYKYWPFSVLADIYLYASRIGAAKK